MTKRLFWLATGFGLGIAATRRLRRSRSGNGARPSSAAAASLRARVDDAVSEGRHEMRRREAALRHLFAEPGGGRREPER